MRQGIPLGALVSAAAPPSRSSSSTSWRTREQLRKRRWSSGNNRKTRHALPESSFANRQAVHLILSFFLSLSLGPQRPRPCIFVAGFHGANRESPVTPAEICIPRARVHPSSFMSSYRRLNEMQTTRVWTNCLSLLLRWEICSITLLCFFSFVLACVRACVCLWRNFGISVCW